MPALNNHCESLLRILEAGSFREACKNLKDTMGKSTSYSVLARRAGYQSRGYIRDVITGSKKLTNENSKNIVGAFQLPNTWEKYLIHLAELEISLSQRKINQKEYIVLLKKLQNQQQKSLRFLEKDLGKAENASKRKLYQIAYFTEIYAALGEIGLGKSLEEIQHLTGIPKSVVQGDLELMLELELIEKKEDIFFAKEQFIKLTNQERRFLFHSQINRACQRVMKKSHEPNADNLFSYSSISIKEKNLPIFKKKLEQLIHEYLVEAESSEGDRIASLMVAFYT